MISRFVVQPVARCTWVMISAQRGAAALPPVALETSGRLLSEPIQTAPE